MRFLVALVMIACGCEATRPPCRVAYPATDVQRPFLWEVRGPTGNVVVLYGTYHAAGEDDIAPAALAALDRSQVFVAEVEELSDRDKENEAIEDLIQLPRGVSLHKLLGDELFGELQSRVPDVSYWRLTRSKPWVAMMFLTKAVFQFPSPNISEALLDRARDRKLATEFFDTLVEQTHFLDQSAGTIKLADAIRKAPVMHCGMQYRVDAFRAGDDRVFSNDIPDEGDPIVARMARWFAQLERYLHEGRPAFVAIGTAYLLGPFGFVARLEAAGYKVRRL